MIQDTIYNVVPYFLTFLLFVQVATRDERKKHTHPLNTLQQYDIKNIGGKFKRTCVCKIIENY